MLATKKKSTGKRKALQSTISKTPVQKEKYRAHMILFLVKFFVIYFLFTTLLELVDLSLLTQFIAGIAAQPFGFIVQESTVLVGAKSFLVTNSCTGLSSAIILAALVFGLKKPSIRKKLRVFVIGVTALLILNIPRVMLVLFAAKTGFDADTMHVYTWFLMSGAIILLWYYGNKKIAKVKDFGEMI